MAPKLYGDTRSPCVRAVLIAANILNVDLEYVEVNVTSKEQLSEEYLKINPRHSVPTLDDNGFVVWDSHAIMMYLAEKYGNDNPLYPRDIQKRAAINQMLHFETGDIFAIHRYIVHSVIHNKLKAAPAEPLETLQKGYEFVETFLKNSKFVAGSEISLADISIWTTFSNSRHLVPIEESKYPKIKAWVETMDRLPCSNLNKEGCNEFTKLLDVLMGK